jgi:hypothetical protein
MPLSRHRNSGDVPLLRYEVLSQGLRDGLGSVANAELALTFFQVGADGLLAKIEFLCYLAELLPHGEQPQDCQFPRSQATT